ncbi:choice-of-anchor J domain-containing protein [Crocinitomix catalasitica]|nr:choice-of-anchor J domain-containing protein [Crocinitomix catalasitica]
MKRLLHIFIFIVPLLSVGCKKEYDSPPIAVIPGTDIVTIDSLRNWQAASGIVSFTQELSVYGIITMDESDGNIYKNVYMQDMTGGINMRLLSGGGLYVGDSVRVYLKGCFLSEYNGVLQLDSVDVDNNIVKQSTANSFEPEITTIDMITTAKESELIKLQNVQFINPDLGTTFADAVGLQSENKLLEDCSGNRIIVRTSGYSSFADEDLPTGNGDIVCIVNHYNGELQLIIRSYAEVQMTGARCSGLLFLKDFDDGSVTSGGWTVQQVDGTYSWYTDDAGGAPNDYGVISNYDGSSNYTTDSWLISPSFDLTGATAPYLKFDNAWSYPGDLLQVLVSTNYVSGAPASGTWVPLAPLLSGGFFVWVNSGNVDLTPYIGSNVHIAFQYIGSSSDGSTWEVENIEING